MKSSVSLVQTIYVYMKTDITEKDFYSILEQTQEGRKYLEYVYDPVKFGRPTVREKGYELHHICPRAFLGSNAQNNLVKLTVYEHCEAHLLLAKAFPCYETFFPITKLCGRQIKELTDLERLNLEELYHFSELRYEALHSKKPEHQRQRIAEANRQKAKDPEFLKLLRKPKSEATKAKLRKPKSEEHRQKLSKKNVEKGQEYQRQKEEFQKTGIVGPLLRSMQLRTEKTRELNDLKRKVAKSSEFEQWYEKHCYNSEGKRLNKLSRVPMFLKEVNKLLESYS